MTEMPLAQEIIFARALKIESAAEREAFLDRACGDDPTLRAYVEALLRADAQSGDLLDLPERLTASLGLPGVERPGAVIGPYELIREIGEGGMGVVWLAEQAHPVRRKVALKIIKPGMDSRRVIARFEAERQALAMMDHPNIAKVFDAGTTESGRPFFIMELVDGVPITVYCDDHQLLTRHRLVLFVAVCHAVQHAHQKGIIHRDLKPSNVLVADCDGEPVPRVIDFGVAKAAGPELAGRTTFTHDGQIVGTLEYMSPEQATFNAPDIDTRSDIYSLGVLLYQLLTGSMPFRKERLGHAALDDVLRMIREEEPPRPSARLLEVGSLPSLAPRRRLEGARLARQLRGDLDWIVMKCLEKDRSRRYETASGLARDIQRYLADEAVDASPPSTVYRLRKALRRHRGPVLAASIIVLLLIVGIVGTTVGLVQAEAARQSAEKRLAQVERGGDILGSIFEDLDPKAEEKERRPLRAILGDRLDRAAAELDGEAVGDPLVVARLQDRLGRTYLGLGHSASAESLFAKALATRNAHLGADHALSLASLHNRALALDSAGRSDEAIALLERVRNTRASRLGAEHPDTLATENDLALIYWGVGRPNEAVALLERVRGVRVAKLGGDHALTLAALESLADAYVGAGRGDEAVELLEKVRDVRAKQLGPEHPAALRSLESLAFAYQSVGQMKRSVALFEKARDAVVPRFGTDHPQTLRVLDNLAAMYRAFGRTGEAIALAEQVRDARMKSLGAYHPDTILTLNNLALAYHDAGKLKQALPLFQQAAAGLEKLEFTHGHASKIVGNLCSCLERMGQLDQSMLWRQKWLAAEREKAGPKSAAYAKNMVQVGDFLGVGKRYADAEPILREGLAILLKVGPADWETSHAQTLLGEALLGQKKYAEAEPFLIQGYEGLKAREAKIPWLLAGHLVAGAGESVGELYEAWGQPEKAAAWRSKLKGPAPGHPVPAHSRSTH